MVGRKTSHRWIGLAGLLLAAWQLSTAAAQIPLASGLLRILGARLTVEAPASVPINAPSSLPTQLVDGDGTPIATDTLFSSPVFVTGELSGAGLDAAVVLGPIPLGTPLPVPPLTRAGNYVVDHLRLTDAIGTEILPATPAAVRIKALENVFVTTVSSRPLSLDEIQNQGIILDPNNFSAYEFTFGVATPSSNIPLTFQMVFPKDPASDSGGLGLPPTAPDLPVPNFDIQGFLFKTPDDLQGEPLPPIPGVIVIPGNLVLRQAQDRLFLHQFFQVQVLVSQVGAAPHCRGAVLGASA